MRIFDLKPCPFCGNPKPQVVWDSGDEDKLGVKCFKCGGCIDTEKDTAEEAVEAWNNRAGADLERYSDKLWREAYERGKADRPRGEWLPCSFSGLLITEQVRKEGIKWYGYRCSNCDHIRKGNALIECNYCPYCGADMRKENDR